MAQVTMPMPTSVTIKAILRPRVSPKCPNTSAPSGRDTKAATSVPTEPMHPEMGSVAAKKIFQKTRVEQKMKRKKRKIKIVPLDGGPDQARERGTFHNGSSVR